MAKEPTYLANLRKVTRKEVDTLEEHDALVRELYGQNDRATVLLFSALVERSLEALLKTKMDPERVGAIFGSDGVLSAFSAKIKMAYAMSLIGLETRHDLDLIRYIRNEFAHSKVHFNFATPEVGPCCDALAIMDRKDPSATGAIVIYAGDEKGDCTRVETIIHDAKDPKNRFMLTCNNLAHRMVCARTGEPFTGVALP